MIWKKIVSLAKYYLGLIAGVYLVSSHSEDFWVAVTSSLPRMKLFPFQLLNSFSLQITCLRSTKKEGGFPSKYPNRLSKNPPTFIQNQCTLRIRGSQNPMVWRSHAEPSQKRESSQIVSLRRVPSLILREISKFLSEKKITPDRETNSETQRTTRTW